MGWKRAVRDLVLVIVVIAAGGFVLIFYGSDLSDSSPDMDAIRKFMGHH